MLSFLLPLCERLSDAPTYITHRHHVAHTPPAPPRPRLDHWIGDQIEQVGARLDPSPAPLFSLFPAPTSPTEIEIQVGQDYQCPVVSGPNSDARTVPRE